MLRNFILLALLVLSAPALGQPATPRVALQTSEGMIVLELETARAPVTAANFLRYVDARRLDGTAFYRAMKLRSDWGLVQGGVQSLSRSFFGRLVPPQRSGEFFGFFNMMGKFAAVLGPMLMGWVALILHSSRLAIVSIAVLFAAGGILLCLVKEERA